MMGKENLVTVFMIVKNEYVLHVHCVRDKFCVTRSIVYKRQAIRDKLVIFVNFYYKKIRDKE